MTIEKKIVVGFALALAVLITVGTVSYHNTLKLIENNRWVAHTHEVLNEIESTLSMMKDAETGGRGYTITGDERFLEPYQAALSQIGGHLARLKYLTADNPQQQQRLAALDSLIADKINHLEEKVALRHAKGFEAAQQEISSGRGKQKMDEIRRLVAEMKSSGCEKEWCEMWKW